MWEEETVRKGILGNSLSKYPEVRRGVACATKNIMLLDSLGGVRADRWGGPDPSQEAWELLPASRTPTLKTFVVSCFCLKWSLS